MTNKITERDIYNAMIDGTIDAETLRTFAEKKIAQLDKRNEGAKRRAAAKREAGNEMTEIVLSYVTNEPKDRAQIANEMIEAGIETTVAKVGARLNILVADGKIVKEKGKVADEEGKSKTVTLYTIA